MMDTSPQEERLEAVAEGTETKLDLARRVIRQMRRQLEALECLLEEGDEIGEEAELMIQEIEGEQIIGPALDGRLIDGVFDGEQMVGEDGQKYLVPANYASKSKLVEGDLLRLTINSRGRFIFKQKGPIERQRLTGTLVQDEQTDRWQVVAGGNKFRVLSAAISYYHGEPGDEAVILVPKSAPSKWAAVENVIKRQMEEQW